MKKAINKDILKWMILPIISNVICDVGVSVIAIKIAEYMGSLTDAVFKLDLSVFDRDIKKLVIYIVINLLLIPFVKIINDFLYIWAGTLSDNEMCARIPHWDYHKLMKIPEGDITYILEDELTDFRINYSTFVSNIITIPIVTIYLFKCSKALGLLYTLIALCITALKLIVPMLTKNVSASYDKSSKEYGSSIKNEIIEIVENASDIRMLNIGKAYLAELEKTFKEYYKKVQIKDIKLKSLSDGGKATIDILSKLIIILVGCYLVSIGKITTGCIVIMMNYQDIYGSLISKIGDIITGVPSLKMEFNRIKIFYEDMEEISGTSVGDDFILEAKDLEFSYDDKAVFNNLCFRINSGDKISICGKNGSGKSTLFKIICGLEKDYGGSIKINNKELKDINILDWRSKIAVAFQEPYLFSGTVEENISLGNLSATDNDIKNVMKLTGIDYLYGKTIVYNTNELSGGEKQRISIARALLKNTDIMLLDEPSNNLDAKAIEWLNDFIIHTEKTIIFITHDLKLMRVSDYCVNLTE